MDVFQKLKSTVTGALPGNPVTREFDLGRHVASAGPGLLWKIYDAVKKTTKQEASVFMFEKKLIDRYSKRDKELIVEHLKTGVCQLTRLRHPKILSVYHPLEESRETLAFATEPVFASLANVLGYRDNMPDPLPPGFKEHELYEVEIKYGLLQLVEGLAFLHNDAKMLHRNVCLESVIINKNGAWKLSGFESSLKSCNPSSQQAAFPFKEWDENIPPVVQPNLDFLAPEFILTMTCHIASDLYSLGILIYALYNGGRPLFECQSQLSAFRSNAAELRRLKGSVLGKVPDEMRDHVKLLLNVEPSVRPDAHQMSQLPFFQDVGVMTLHYLDTLFHQQDNLAKSKFFKGLPQVVVKMPKRINLERMLPSLFQACANHDMVPFVLPNILLVAEKVESHEFVKHILPNLKSLFAITEPVQVLLIFMQNMSLLLSKTPADDIKCHVLPMIFRAIESSAPQIQELCLQVLPTFASLIEYSSMKNAVIPRLKKLCLATQSLNIRVNSLVCIGKLMEFLDRWAVLDDVLPMLPEINCREPAVLVSILGIYKVALTHEKLGITKDILATKVLPFLIPLSIDNKLNLSQYNAFTTVISDMVSRVEKEHRTKLEQLNSMEKEQRTLQFSQEPVSNANNLVSVPAVGNKQDSMMDKFLSGFGGMFSSGDANKAQTIADTGQKTLSLAEKQRLAEQQEMQRRLKSQTPLTSSTAVKSQTPLTASKVVKTMQSTQVKDLTSTLTSSSANKPSYNLSSFSSTPSTMGSSQAQSSKQLDLSSLDNLLPSSSGRTKQPIGSMKSGSTGMMGSQYVGQSIAGGMVIGGGHQNTITTGQTAVMGGQVNRMGNPSLMMSNHGNMMNAGNMMSAGIRGTSMVNSQGGYGNMNMMGGLSNTSMNWQSGGMAGQGGMTHGQFGMMSNSGMMVGQSLGPTNNMSSWMDQQTSKPPPQANVNDLLG